METILLILSSSSPILAGLLISAHMKLRGINNQLLIERSLNTIEVKVDNPSDKHILYKNKLKELLISNKSKAAGYLYVVHNPSWGEDVYKIGSTTRSSTSQRYKEISGYKISIEEKLLFKSTDVKRLEDLVHKWLVRHKVDGELFSLDIPAIEEAIRQVGEICGIEIERV